MLQMLGPRIHARLLEILDDVFFVFNVEKRRLSMMVGIDEHCLQRNMWGNRFTDERFLKMLHDVLNCLALYEGVTSKKIELRVPDGDLLFEFDREYQEHLEEGGVI